MGASYVGLCLERMEGEPAESRALQWVLALCAAMWGLLIKTWIPLLAFVVNILGESFISLCLGVFVGNAGLQ